MAQPDSIVGTWALVRGTHTAADGTALAVPYGGPLGLGRVTFTADGRMVAVMCDGRPTLPPGMAREYGSYCGTYTFDGKRLVTKVFANSDPSRFDADQVRDVRFEGALMVLRPPPRATGAGPVGQRELWWQKIAAV